MKVIMKVNNISKSYINGEIKNDVLTNINLDIMEGELTAILGRNGSGKTTLLNIMGGIDIPYEGEVFWGDKEIFCLSEKEKTLLRRKKIGFVFQSYQLIQERTFSSNLLPKNVLYISLIFVLHIV
ncbi:MAG: ATP-binding cassette domain-containing protein [Lachnospiraceae bacterium]|nr:ATP-binding cassette domain-containing protein [Lachnospiraceae bacterium]